MPITKKELEKMISETLQREQELRLELGKVEAELSVLRTLIEREKNSPEVPTDDANLFDGPPTFGSLRDGSFAQAAAQVLWDNGKAMHIKDILKAVGKSNTRADRANYGRALKIHADKGRVFKKMRKPATYGLLEWNKKG